MLIQQVQIAVQPGQESAFEAALLDVRRHAFQAPGFRRFDVAQDLEEPGHYQVRVLWETAEELRAFTVSDRFEATWAPIHPFLTRPLLIDVLVQRPGLDFQGPGVLGDPVVS